MSVFTSVDLCSEKLEDRLKNERCAVCGMFGCNMLFRKIKNGKYDFGEPLVPIHECCVRGRVENAKH